MNLKTVIFYKDYVWRFCFRIFVVIFYSQFLCTLCEFIFVQNLTFSFSVDSTKEVIKYWYKIRNKYFIGIFSILVVTPYSDQKQITMEYPLLTTCLSGVLAAVAIPLFCVCAYIIHFFNGKRKFSNNKMILLHLTIAGIPTCIIKPVLLEIELFQGAVTKSDVFTSFQSIMFLLTHLYHCLHVLILLDQGFIFMFKANYQTTVSQGRMNILILMAYLSTILILIPFIVNVVSLTHIPVLLCITRSIFLGVTLILTIYIIAATKTRRKVCVNTSSLKNVEKKAYRSAILMNLSYSVFAVCPTLILVHITYSSLYLDVFVPILVAIDMMGYILDPFIYIFANQNYKQKFMQLITCRA